jgi:hypothetical protein
MTTVLRFGALAGLFCGTVFDVAVPGSSFSDGAKYNQFATLCPSLCRAHSITVQSTVKNSGLGLGVRTSTSLQG